MAMHGISIFENYHLAAGKFAGGNISGIVGHTWSLALDWKFYLIMAFFVYILSLKQFAYLCFLMIAAAPIARWLIFKESGNIYMADVPLPECLDMMAYVSRPAWL